MIGIGWAGARKGKREETRGDAERALSVIFLLASATGWDGMGVRFSLIFPLYFQMQVGVGGYAFQATCLREGSLEMV